MIRKFASNIVITNKEFHKNHVVELFDHIVQTHYPLLAEQPMTEWIGGSIIIIGVNAYHSPHVLTQDEIKAALEGTSQILLSNFSQL